MVHDETESVSAGFIFVARKVGDPEHWIWRLREPAFRLFWWLLLKARWRDGKYLAPDGSLITVKRGQYTAPVRRLAEETGLSHQKTRTALNSLRSCGFLTHEVTHGVTVITICNYEFYQDPATYFNTPSNKALTQGQHKPNTDTYKENIKNIKTSNKYIREENMNAEEKRIFDEWNEHARIKPQHRVFTSAMRKAVSARLKRFSVEEICTSIRNYGDSTDPFWVEWREVKRGWALDQFLSRGEGAKIEKFLAGPINESRRHTGNVGGGRRFLNRGDDRG